MKIKTITSSNLKGPKIAIIISCLFCAFLVFACGGGGGGGGSSPSNFSSGSVSFNLNWPDTTEGNSLAAALDCTDAGVVTVTANIYDEAGDLIASGGPWGCSLHSGTIDNVPAGTDRKLVVSAYDADGNEKYRATKTGITVTGGQTNEIGDVQAFADLAIGWAYLQYRNYETSSYNRYIVWVPLTRFGDPIELADILDDASITAALQADPDIPTDKYTTRESIISDLLKDKIILKDSSGSAVVVNSAYMGFEKPTYFKGAWNSSTSSVDFTGPHVYSGFFISFNSGIQFSAGNYTFHVTATDGTTVEKTIYFPGKVELAFVESSSMNHQFGSLDLTWTNPNSDFDQIRVKMRDQFENEIFFGWLPSDKESLSIPTAWVNTLNQKLGPEAVRWQVETQNFGNDDNNYARGISNRACFNDGPQLTVAGKYDLIKHFPLTRGSYWHYQTYNSQGTPIYQDIVQVEEIEDINGVKSVQRNWRNYSDCMTDDYDLFRFDGEYLYNLADREIENSYDDDAPGYYIYKPPIKIKRFLGVGEESTCSGVRVDPDGTQRDYEFTFKIVAIEDVTVPEGTFQNCLKVIMTTKRGPYTEVEASWFAPGVGEVQHQEISSDDPADSDFHDTEKLLYHNVCPSSCSSCMPYCYYD